MLASDDEAWLPVVGYEGLYEVSNFGRVRSLVRDTKNGRRGGRLLSPKYNKGGGKSRGGYLHLGLYDSGKSRHHYLHKLVLEAFVGPRPDGMEVRHFPDRDKSNCRADNLSWATHCINAHDRIGHGTQVRGGSHKLSKLDDDAVRAIRALESSGISRKTLADRYAVSNSLIHLVVRRKIWTHIL